MVILKTHATHALFLTHATHAKISTHGRILWIHATHAARAHAPRRPRDLADSVTIEDF